MLKRRMLKPVYISKYLHVVFETKNKDSEWFGYYNYDTLNQSQTKMIANRIPVDGIAPKKEQTIQVGYYDLINHNWHIIGESDSWNWQQGAMAQWIEGNSKEKIVFNTSDGDHLISKIVDITTGKQKQIDWPIYGVTSDGKKSVSLDLERSYWCRAYHYQSVVNEDKEGLVWQGDGIFEIDLERNVRRRIIDIESIIHTDFKDYFAGCKHWLEHIMINPSGTRFSFLHRFSNPDNVYSYSTRLFVADIDGSNLTLVPGWENTIYTHFGWKSDNEFAIYTYTPYRIKEGRGFRELLKSKDILSKDFLNRSIIEIGSKLPYWLRTRIIGRRSYYQFYKIDEDNTVLQSNKAEGRMFSVDGHPSFTIDGRYMITDSYPWKDGYQRLMVFNTETGKSLILAKLNAYYRGNPASCDLHPKLSKNNKYLVVDAAYDAHHHMILFELNWDLIKTAIS